MRTLRDYQVKLVERAMASLLSGEREVVLAACPGAGKTLMSIEIFGRLLASGAVKRGLVLAHGTTLLRSQYAEALAELALPFSWALHEGRKDDAAAAKAQLVVSIPQSYNGNLGQFDIAIVDEAHEHYRAKTVQGIIAPIKRVLCLTGTPSGFVAKGSVLHAVSLGELYKEKEVVVSDVMVELMDSDRRVNYETDYNASYDLKEDFEFRALDTDGSLDKLLTSLLRRLRLAPGNAGFVPTMQFDAIQAGRISAWDGLLRELKKTMFACRSVKQARQVRDYFKRQGIKAVLSTGEDDPHNEVIERDFKGNPDCVALIVVQRGVLGFNYPGLANVVDLTGSWNIDRIYQLLCRVIRVDLTNRQKLFVKVSSIDPQLARVHMSLALQLMDADWFLMWDGRASTKLNRKVVADPGPRDTSYEKADAPTTRKMPRLDSGMLLYGDFFKDILHRDGALDVYARTTLGDVEKSLGVRSQVQDSAASKSETKAFYSKHGRLPVDWLSAERSERLLCKKMRMYCSLGKTYDPEFHAWAKSAGYGTHGGRAKAGVPKSEIKDFFIKNGRLPSRCPAEIRLARNLNGYCTKGTRYDPEFHAWAKSVGLNSHRDKEQEQFKLSVKEFFSKHGRFPLEDSSCPEEKLLGGRLSRYASPRDFQYDPAFREWAIANGRSTKNASAIGQDTLKRFYLENGRLPRLSVPEERALTWKLKSYCKPSSPAYDPEFHTWAKSIGYTCASREREKRMLSVKEFFHEHGRFPSQHGVSRKEKLLSSRLRAFMRSDSDFHNWIIATGCFQNKAEEHSLEEIKIFYSTTGRLPRRYEEGALYRKLKRHCGRGYKEYDSDFHAWAISVGYGTKSGAKKKNVCA